MSQNYSSRSDSQHRRHRRFNSKSPSARRNLTRPSHGRSYKYRERVQSKLTRCLGVFGLSPETTEDRLRELFTKFGPVDRIQMVNFTNTRLSRGFCFVYFKSLCDARAAKVGCTGMKVDGRRIRADYSLTPRAHTPTPGVYMGRPAPFVKHRENKFEIQYEYSRAHLNDYNNRGGAYIQRRDQDRQSSGHYYSNYRSQRNRRRFYFEDNNDDMREIKR